MKIEKVKLFNYRNLKEEEVILNPLVNVFKGENAQGKTNFLESLYLFSNAKSFRAATEQEQASAGYEFASQGEDRIFTIKEWNLAFVGGDASRCGLAGSPTKVKAVENIVFKAKESKKYTASGDDIKSFVSELLANHTIG